MNRFFSYCPECGLDDHATAEEAEKHAGGCLDHYRDDAPDGWDENVTSICWGEIKGSVLETERRPLGWIMRNLQLFEAKDQVPEDGKQFFFISDSFYGVGPGWAIAESSWMHEDSGNQVFVTGKETSEEIKTLILEGYKLEKMYVQDEGCTSPQGNFLWCYTDDIFNIWDQANK